MTEKIELGDKVRVKKGVIHKGLEFHVTAIGRHADGERLIYNGGLLNFRESDVELVAKMTCSR